MNTALYGGWIALFILVISMGVPAPAAEQAPPYLRLLTLAFDPPLAGYVHRIILQEDRLIYGWTGNGQACYDGGAFEVTLPIDPTRASRRRELGTLGENSIMAKDEGRYNSSPGLVAVIPEVDNELIFNIDCAANFPEAYVPGSREGITGNVIRYNPATQRCVNLTKLSGNSGKIAGAVGWFAEEKILLVVEAELETTSDTPGAKRGTDQPVCLTLMGERRPISEYPRIERWYGERQRARLSRSFSKGTGEHSSRWTISGTEPAQSITFDVAAYDIGFRAFRLSRGLVCVGSEHPPRTWLADFEGKLRVKLDGYVAIDYDDERELIFVYSTGQHGDRSYWALDWRAYLATVMAPDPRAAPGTGDLPKLEAPDK